MKTTLVTSCAFAALAVAAGNIMVRETETNLKSKTEFVKPNDLCFDSFLANLKSLDAIIFIPENKATDAKLLGLAPLDKISAKALNLQLTKIPTSYMQIVPSDTITDCGQDNILNFKKLKMVVYVKSDKLSNLKALNLIKIDSQISTFKFESFTKVIKIDNALSPEKLKFKIENNTELVYTPCFKF